MKRKRSKLIIAMIMVMVVSCDEPETVVTNYVHPDGSVTRKIEMRNIKNNFALSVTQVPFDTSWIVKDSIEINEKGDTSWIKRAEKLFKNVEEINLAYKTDSGANRKISRQAGFVKKFRWFNTEFRFSEKIDKTISFGYPVKDFLNSEELVWFYSPEGVKHEKETGPDSLKYRLLNDALKKKTDHWVTKNLVSDWIGEFTKLTKANTSNNIIGDSLKVRENEFVNLIETNGEKFDTIWKSGILFEELLGKDNAANYKPEADSADQSVSRHFFMDFKQYSVRIIMPGNLTGTNGFIDSSKVLLWSVQSDFFLTEPYEMWAVSKVPNRWAWIVSGLFLVFVITGVLIRINKKG